MEWLAASIVLSIVLTVVLNVVVRLFPDASERAARRVERFGSDGHTRVFVPWKAMIVVSLLATLVLNLLLWAR